MTNDQIETEPYLLFEYAEWHCDIPRFLIMPLNNAAIVSGVEMLQRAAWARVIALATVPFQPSRLVAPQVDHRHT